MNDRGSRANWNGWWSMAGQPLSLALVVAVGGGAAAPGVAVLACAYVPAAHAQPAPDPLVGKGRRLFLQCASCHAAGDTNVVRMGPNLKGVVGRKVASFPGYAYSASLKSQSFEWDEARLDRWLQKPTQVAPETTMAFIGLPGAADRQAVIAYLKTLK